MIASARANTGAFRATVSGRAPRRTGLGLVALGTTMMMVALFASPALADRSYDSQLTGAPSTAPVPGPFSSPAGLALDSSDNLWVANVGSGGLMDKFDSSGNFIAQGNGEGNWSGSYTESIAFSNTSDHLYVADSGPDKVWVLNSDASYDSFLFSSTWGGGCCYIHTAAANSSGTTGGDIYISGQNNSIYRTDGAGVPVNFTAGSATGTSALTGADTPAGSFGFVSGMTVDASGNLFVVDNGHRVVDEFAPSGSFVQTFTGAGAPEPFSNSNLTGVAIDPTNDNLLVVDSTHGVVDELESSGAYVGQLTGIGPTESTPFGSLSGGIAVNSTGFVFVSDAANQVVDVFTPNAILPKITYGAVSNQTQTSGSLHATIDPNGGGGVFSCQFEYGTATTYNLGSIPCNPDPADNPPTSNFTTPTGVSVDISGLTSETTYHYRVVVTNANGIRKGSDQTYLPHAVKELTTDAPTEVEPASAVLNGSLVGTGEDTHYFYEWGTSTAYGSSTTVPPGTDAGLINGPGRTSLPFLLSGLTPETTYHYRFVASNLHGTTTGGDQHFTTPPAVAALTTEAASNLTAGKATLEGSFDGTGHATTYYFEYVDETDYDPEAPDPYEAGTTSAPPPGEDAGSGTVHQLVSADVDVPLPGTRYHFRVVAVNTFGTTYGADQVFTSAPPQLPQIAGTSSSNVTEEGALLEAKVNPGLGATVVRFQYGTGHNYGSQTFPTESIGSDDTIHPASVAIAKLEPGTTYHFRAIATNFAGTVIGPDQTFTTSGGSPIVTPPPVVTPPTPPGSNAPPEGSSERCKELSDAAAKSGKQAQKLRGEAKRASSAAQARRLRDRASRAAKRAAQLRGSAARCRGKGRVR